MPSDSPTPPRGLLFSQIGYDAGDPVRLVLRGPKNTLPDEWALRLSEQSVIPLIHWGEIWGSHWWVASAPSTPGTYEATLPLRSDEYRAAWTAAPDHLFDTTWEAVSIAQAERRQRFAEKHEGAPLGWFDAGMHWQEANAHTEYLHGLADLLALRRDQLDAEQTRRLIVQLCNGADYLARLQNIATERNLANGGLVHQSFKIDHLVLASDAAKAAAAFAHVADVLPPHEAGRATDYRRRASLALHWFLEKPRHDGLPFCALPHGAEASERPPAEFSTHDLADCVDAALRLEDPRLFFLVDQWLLRQISQADAGDGPHGHFKLFDTKPWLEKTWTHGFDPQGYGFNLGQTHGHNLGVLVRLLQRFPEHPDHPRWAQSLRNYAYGYFLPACQANPFLLMPLGWVPGEGFIHFASLWHGANATYGHAAALALDLADWFQDPAFRDIATGNLQWIAGLNAGLTRDAILPSSHLWHADIPDGAAQPASMICGIGTRTAGSWLNLRGAICNGFATGDQFQWDTPPTRAVDGPHSFTDEDWITHAGAWLSAISRLNPTPTE